MIMLMYYILKITTQSHLLAIPLLEFEGKRVEITITVIDDDSI